MHAPLSIIFFTVLSGSGFGLSFVLALFHTSLTPNSITAAAIASALLVTIGLSSSVAHLANPKNAWRAVMRVRTSWLSREAVAVMLFFPLLLIWYYQRQHPQWSILLCAISLVSVYCTAMIYQSLKPIAQWHHPLTSANYLLFALLGGTLICYTIHHLHSDKTIQSLSVLLGIATIASCLLKIAYYKRISALKETSTANAIGYSQAAARLLDAGHTAPNFLTREFIVANNPKLVFKLRLTALLLFSLCPLLIITDIFHAAINIIFTLLALLGILVERWLFFREAKHTIRAFYSAPQ